MKSSETAHCLPKPTHGTTQAWPPILLSLSHIRDSISTRSAVNACAGRPKCSSNRPKQTEGLDGGMHGAVKLLGTFSEKPPLWARCTTAVGPRRRGSVMPTTLCGMTHSYGWRRSTTRSITPPCGSDDAPSCVRGIPLAQKNSLASRPALEPHSWYRQRKVALYTPADIIFMPPSHFS